MAEFSERHQRDIAGDCHCIRCGWHSAPKVALFDCMKCGTRLQSTKPTNQQILEYRQKYGSQKLADIGKTLHKDCGTVYPAGEYTTCPSCWMKKHPNQDLDPIMVSKQPKGQQL